MSEGESNTTDLKPALAAVMKRVGAASPHFELEAVRFIECRMSYGAKAKHHNIRFGIADQSVAREDDTLTVAMRFEFVAPSPFESQRDRQVDISAKIEVEYTAAPDRGTPDGGDVEIFAKVNGIYNAWPYLREYTQSSLARLGLPRFELPLLRVAQAAQLAGLVDAPGDGSREPKSDPAASTE